MINEAKNTLSDPLPLKNFKQLFNAYNGVKLVNLIEKPMNMK